ncbi:MAG: hypothetical protein U5L74_04065 [Ideonella sp.]|nr:hypothetical protein [Ideonella sp.]
MLILCSTPWRFSALALLLATTLPVARATETALPTHFQALRLTADDAPLRLDGRLDDAVWQRAPRHSHFAQRRPTANGPVPEGLRTEVQVVVDDKALIFGVRAWDTQTPQVLLSRRDGVQADQDHIGIWLDTTGRRNAAVFVKAGLAGVVSDGQYRAADDEDDLGPDFPVEMAVAQLADGYSLELRWPLAALRYPFHSEAPWGLLVARAVPKAQDLWLLSQRADPEALSLLSHMLPLEGLGEVLQRHRQHSISAVRAEWTLRQSQAAGQRQGEGTLGLEALWRPRADWVFNTTLNPDFAQVEIDAPQARGNRSLAIELPEKRSYFLESADVLGLTAPAFYSRTVADPRWGVRSTWRGVQADATALVLEDRAGALVLRGRPWGTEAWQLSAPSSAVLLRGRWQSEHSTLGLMAGERKVAADQANRVAGLDGVGRWNAEDEHLQWRWHGLLSENSMTADAQGRTVARPGAPERGARLWAQATHSNPEWFNFAEASWVAPEFVNLQGFSSQAGLWQAKLELNRRLGERTVPLGAEGLTLHESELHLGVEESRSLRDRSANEPGGEVISRALRVGGWLQGPWRTVAWANVGPNQQRARSGGLLHPIPNLQGGLETTPWPWLTRLAVNGSWGRQLDSELDRVGTGGWWALEAKTRWALPGGQSLELDPVFTGLRIGPEAGHPGLQDLGWQVLALWHLDARRSLRAIVQQERSQRDAAGASPGSLSHSQHRSLMWRQRLNSHWQVSAGAQWDAARLQASSREWFVKLQWDSGL